MHSQFAANSIRKALADASARSAHPERSQFNSQRIELAILFQLARGPLQGTRTSQTSTRSELGPASSTRNTRYSEYAVS
eukprot:12581655-Alexandrium_andersonii.AAC.1